MKTRIRQTNGKPPALGFTVIELMVTLAVAAILASLAAPSMRTLIERRHLEGAAREVVGNLVLARSQAIEKNRPSFVSFSIADDVWSYGLDDIAACDPLVADDCQLNGSERVYDSQKWRDVNLTHTFAADEVSFEPRRGMVSDPATVRVASPAGTVEIQLSPIGYVSACGVGAAVGRYEVCA
ncbi:MAG: GspH/FimT family pseudopilin [Panacagrimonas sp.]